MNQPLIDAPPRPPRSQTTQHLVPDSDAIALLEPFERLGLGDITLVSTGAQARAAHAALAGAPAWGFDTESKPTFRVGDVSDGPHIVQLATRDHAWVFQLHDPECREVVAQLMTLPGHVKAGFGLGDDRKRIISKLGVQPEGVLELNTLFRDKGYRKEMGDCSGPDGMSTGGHFNPTGAPHGAHDHSQRHAGDLASLKADATGLARFSYLSDAITVGSGVANVVGRGLIVHRDPDDFKTQPTGNSGPRVACAVITQG